MTAREASLLLEGLRAVVSAPAGLHEPEFAGREWDYVKECLDTGWVSSVGAYVDRFEADLAAFTGAGRAVVTSNGTSALQVALFLCGVGSGDEVLLPSLTFVGTANAVAHTGAVPHFVDSAEDTLGVDPAALEAHLERVARRTDEGPVSKESGRRIAAIVPVHVFGHPCDMTPLLDVAERWGLPVVEDAAESLGSTYQGRHCGTFGRIGAVSFNGNKIVTTGGGGALLTDDEELGRRAKHLTTTAKAPHRWEFRHDEVAWNFRMPNLNAALGCAQLERLPDMLARKRVLTDRYAEALAGLPFGRLVREPAGSRSNHWLNALLLDRGQEHLRDALLEATNAAGLMTRPAWEPMHELPMFTGCPRAELPVAQSLAARLINLPSSPGLAGPPGSAGLPG